LLLAIAIFILAFSGYTVRNRLQYQKLLAESAKKLIRLEESDKARVAAEIHDIAGLLLYTKANLVEISETEDRKVNNGFTHELGLLSERLRLLSHRISPALEHDLDFQEIITGLCNDLTSLSGITFHLNMKQPDYGLSDDQKVQIYRIIQELLINGVKYVKSGNIDLSLESQLGNFFVFYRDEGPGFDLEFIKDKGLGIHNIFERCKFLGGIASLKTVPGNGTEWTISIPLIKK
jgi:signal transduction histidine kinase